MGNAKYYTPSIEEFHVGFECEIEYKHRFVDAIVDFSPLDKEVSFVCTNENYCLIITEEILSSHKIRVKHLDREDIEECGWVFNRKSGPSQIFKLLKSENVNLVYQFDDKLDKSPFINIYFSNGPEFTYDMKIKNKSELKKLLSQLGI